MALEIEDLERAREYAERACELSPQVAAYHDAPQQYIWNRVNALMIYLHVAAFATCDRKSGDAAASIYHGNAWSAFAEYGLTRLWGTVNRRGRA